MSKISKMHWQSERRNHSVLNFLCCDTTVRWQDTHSQSDNGIQTKVDKKITQTLRTIRIFYFAPDFLGRPNALWPTQRNFWVGHGPPKIPCGTPHEEYVEGKSYAQARTGGNPAQLKTPPAQGGVEEDSSERASVDTTERRIYWCNVTASHSGNGFVTRSGESIGRE
jgi:hypothetical protein